VAAGLVILSEAEASPTRSRRIYAERFSQIASRRSFAALRSLRAAALKMTSKAEFADYAGQSRDSPIR